MRTRRSPRNQERLFRALFAPPPQPKDDRPILTDEEIDALPISRPAKAAMRREMQAARYRRARDGSP